MREQFLSVCVLMLSLAAGHTLTSTLAQALGIRELSRPQQFRWAHHLAGHSPTHDI